MARSREFGGNIDEQLDRLVRNGRLGEARDLLLRVAEKRPRNETLLYNLAEICTGIDDWGTLFWAADRLIALDKRDFDAHAHRFNAAIQLAMPGVAIGTVKIMSKLPHDPEYDEQIDLFQSDFNEKEYIVGFRKERAEEDDDFSDYTDDKILDLLVDHERSLFYLGTGRFETVIEICDRIIRSCPIFRSSFNNRALAVLLSEGAEKAGRDLDDTVARFPDNVFALSFKIQQLVKLGRQDEAEPLLQRLKLLKPKVRRNNNDFFSAKMDTFAWAGDEASLLEAFGEAKADAGEHWKIDEDRNCAHMAHFAAVAHALRGEKDEAVALWRQANRCPGAGGGIAENYADFLKPEWDRNGPWYFDANDWVPRQFFADLRDTAFRYGISEEEDPEIQERLLRRHIYPLYDHALARWPYLKSLRLDMLRRGDESVRQWVLMTLGADSDPAFVDALTAFSTGREGTDAFRFTVLQELGNVGLLKSGIMQRWRKGKPSEEYVFGFEIHWNRNTTGTKLTDSGIDTLTEATELIGEMKLERAVEVLEKLDEKEPNDRSVLYNIAVCKEAMGKQEEYRLMLDRILELYPEYIFARAGKAKWLAVDKRFDESFEIFTELLALPRLHGSEAIAIIGAFVVYHLAKGGEEAANSVYRMGQSMFPDRFPSWDQLRREAGFSTGWTDGIGRGVKRFGSLFGR